MDQSVEFITLNKQVTDDGYGLKFDDNFIINTVEPGTPAAKANLTEGDVILSINGRAVSNELNIDIITLVSEHPSFIELAIEHRPPSSDNRKRPYDAPIETNSHSKVPRQEASRDLTRTNHAANSVVKKKICRDWAEGQCTRGSSCSFAHGNEEIHNFKKILCKNFEANGSCPHGAECHFAHGVHELNADAGPSIGHKSETRLPVGDRPPRSSNGGEVTICKHFKEGTCSRGDTCYFAHVKDPGSNFKKLPCKNLAMTGHCSFGNKCTYMHGDEKVSGGPKIAAPVRSKAIPTSVPPGADPSHYKKQICKNWRDNSCTRGRECFYAHGVKELANYKRVICKNFETTGKCEFGAECSFAHGEKELINSPPIGAMGGSPHIPPHKGYLPRGNYNGFHKSLPPSQLEMESHRMLSMPYHAINQRTDTILSRTILDDIRLEKLPGFGGYGFDYEIHHDGLRIVDIEINTPAHYAGLKLGDVITILNGYKMSTLLSQDDVSYYAQVYPSHMDIKVIRKSPSSHPLPVGNSYNDLPSSISYPPPRENKSIPRDPYAAEPSVNGSGKVVKYAEF